MLDARIRMAQMEMEILKSYLAESEEPNRAGTGQDAEPIAP